ELDAGIIDEGAEDPYGVRSATDARDHNVREGAEPRKALLARLSADDRLEVAHHRRIRVRTDRGTEEVIRGAHIRDPVADRLVDRVLEGLASRVDLSHLGAETLHPENVRLLTADV